MFKMQTRNELTKKEKENLLDIFFVVRLAEQANLLLKELSLKILKFHLKFFFFYYQINNSNFLKLQTDITTNDTLGFHRKLLRNCLLETYVRFFS